MAGFNRFKRRDLRKLHPEAAQPTEVAIQQGAGAFVRARPDVQDSGVVEPKQLTTREPSAP